MLAKMNKFMEKALKEGLSNIPIKSRQGGPFGAVIVKDDIIIASAHNEVGLSQDPTMHAEIVAIKKAIEYLQHNDCSRKRFDFLKGCEIYCTCFPCPMCLGAIYWANIKNIYYGCSTIDAGKYKLGDDEIYSIINKVSDNNILPNEANIALNFQQIDQSSCLLLFEEWANREKVKDQSSPLR